MPRNAYARRRAWQLATRSDMKSEALQRMKFLRFNQQVIDDFRWYDKIWVFTNNSRYRIKKHQKDRVHRFEYEYDCLVYAVLEDDVLSFLFVSNQFDQWKESRESLERLSPMAYIVNDMDNVSFSNFGCIGISLANNGRIKKA